MTPTDHHMSSDEIAQLGPHIYARVVVPNLRPEHDGKYVAVEVRTGDYEIDDDDYAAVMRLHARHPDAAVWIEMAGMPTAYRILRGQ